jgi:putative membrane protein
MSRSSKPLSLLIIPALLIVSGVSLTLAQSADRPLRPLDRSASPDSADRALVLTLSKADRDEVAMSRAALPALRDPDVKKYAQMMVDDHTHNLAEVTSIAHRLGYPLAPEGMMAGMGTVTSDAQYLSSEVAGHQSLLAELPMSDTAIKDAALRTQLGTTRQAVQNHLDKAKGLQMKVSGMPSTTP